MIDDLDLSGVHGRFEPEPAFRFHLRRQVEAVVRGSATLGSPATPADELDLDEENMIMLETEDRPTRQAPETPNGRSGRWLLVAAAAAVVALLGTLVAAAGSDDGEEKVDTATSIPTTVGPQNMLEVEGFSALEPGRYYVDPDGDANTPLRVTYQIPAKGWSQWLGATRDAPGGHTGFSITTMTNVVTDGCHDVTPLNPPVGPSVDDLATALAQLAPFEVTAAPTDVTFKGYSGKHLQLTIPDLPTSRSGFAGCVDQNLHGWISPLVGGAFWGYGEAGSTEDFWILDVEGTRLVLVQDTSPRSPAEDIAEREVIFDSFEIEP